MKKHLKEISKKPMFYKIIFDDSYKDPDYSNELLTKTGRRNIGSIISKFRQLEMIWIMRFKL